MAVSNKEIAFFVYSTIVTAKFVSCKHDFFKSLSFFTEEIEFTSLAKLQGIPFRTLETFSSDKIVSRFIADAAVRRIYLENIYDYLVKRKYFKTVRRLLEEKVPPLYDVVLSPPNSMSETLLQMIQHPLRLLLAEESKTAFALSDHFTQNTSPVISHGCSTLIRIANSFVEEILVPEYTPPIQLFILPCLANSDEFPFFYLLQYFSYLIVDNSQLHDDNQMEGQQHQQQSIIVDYQSSQEHGTVDNRQQEFVDNLFSSSFLLVSFLTLDQMHFNRMHTNAVHVRNYIKVLGKLSNNIRKLPHRPSVSMFRQNDEGVERDDDDSDSEDNNRRISTGSDSVSPLERECLLEVITLLNEEKRAHLIVDHYEAYLDDFEVLHSLCKICHNLMLYHRTAVFEFR